MSDGGYYAIKGFEFQIDKTILEIFEAKGNTPICLEQIQDINSNNFVMQVKYKETQPYTPAKIKEPVIQLLNEYKTAPSKKYYLYCYFNDVEEEQRTLTASELDKILGNKRKDFTEVFKKGFIGKFELHFSKTFQEQFLEAVEAIGKNVSCSSFDEALIFYGSITSYLRKIIVNNTDVIDRTCVKSEIIKIITENRKIVFDSAYRIYKGTQQYINEIRKQYFTYLNIDNWERFIIIELSGTESVSAIKTVVLKIRNKFYKKLARKIKSGAPYIYFKNISKENLKRLKTELIVENHIIKDGYDFMDACFRKESIKVKSTIENDISIKFINNRDELKAILDSDLGRAKKIYQFYYTAPVELSFDIDTVNVEISAFLEIQQILK